MNSLNNSNSTQVSRVKRESNSGSSKENKDFLSERQQYIAECKRLLNGLRSCQVSDSQDATTSLNEIRLELPVNEESKNFEGIEIIEKYLLEFDQIYYHNKLSLLSKLLQHNNFEERKQVLDDFFSQIENKATQIRSLKVYNNIKNNEPLTPTVKISSPTKVQFQRQDSGDGQLKPIKLTNLNESPKKLFQDIKNTPTSQEHFKNREQENAIKFRKHMNSKKSDTPMFQSQENDENFESYQQKSANSGKENSARRNKGDRKEQRRNQDSFREKHQLKDSNNKNILKQHKTQSKQMEEEIFPLPDIQKVISLDSQVINYGQFICGKILGSTLQLTNSFEKELVIDIKIDEGTAEFSCDEIFGPYQRNELPFEYEDGSNIINSEKELKCWFIENPVSKELVKNLSIRIGPKSEKEFIIVLKAPNNRQQYNLASFITIQYANQRRSSQNEEERLIKQLKKQLNPNQEIETVIEEKGKESQMHKVMILGKLQNPKIECLRELWHNDTQTKILPIGIKKAQANQKYRIPFRNLSSTQDAEFEFTFVKIPNQEDNIEKEILSCVEFYCQPSILKIQASQQGFLNQRNQSPKSYKDRSHSMDKMSTHTGVFTELHRRFSPKRKNKSGLFETNNYEVYNFMQREDAVDSQIDSAIPKFYDFKGEIERQNQLLKLSKENQIKHLEYNAFNENYNNYVQLKDLQVNEQGEYQLRQSLGNIRGTLGQNFEQPPAGVPRKYAGNITLNPYDDKLRNPYRQNENQFYPSQSMYHQEYGNQNQSRNHWQPKTISIYNSQLNLMSQSQTPNLNAIQQSCNSYGLPQNNSNISCKQIWMNSSMMAPSYQPQLIYQEQVSQAIPRHNTNYELIRESHLNSQKSLQRLQEQEHIQQMLAHSQPQQKFIGSIQNSKEERMRRMVGLNRSFIY